MHVSPSVVRRAGVAAGLRRADAVNRLGADAVGVARWLPRDLPCLEAELRGTPGQTDAFDFMATHPRTSDRIAQAVASGAADLE